MNQLLLAQLDEGEGDTVVVQVPSYVPGSPCLYRPRWVFRSRKPKINNNVHMGFGFKCYLPSGYSIQVNKCDVGVSMRGYSALLPSAQS
jgi:hypothetical protein